MKRLLNAVLIFTILMVFMFVGMGPAMAFTGTMAVNQGGSYTDVERLHQNSMQSSAFLEETRPFLNTNIRRTALTTPQPAPTFHVGKIYRYMI